MGNFVIMKEIMNERSAKIVNFIRFSVYTYVYKSLTWETCL